MGDPSTIAMSGTHTSACAEQYARRLLAQMNKMRLQEDFCDVRLCVGGRVFGVHRLVLAASGPYFAALFSGAMREAHAEQVVIEGVEADIFEKLLEFIYSGHIDVTVDNVQELMVAADMLHLSEVMTICGEFLQGQIDATNCIGIYQFLERITCMDSVEFTESYIYVHFPEVCKGEEFLNLTKDQLIKLLKSEELQVEDEFQVFRAAMDWLQQDTAGRKKHVGEVLDAVRFPLLSPKELSDYIEGVSDFSLQVALRTLLKDYTEISKSSTYYNLLTPAKTKPRRNARKNIYVIGGFTRQQGEFRGNAEAQHCVECFNSIDEYGTMVSPLYHARCGLGVAVLEGSIYVVGGEESSMIFDYVEKYDPVMKQWATVASLNFPRCGVGVCPCNGALYALGGWIGSQIGKTIERYDPAEDKWEVIGTMPVPRHYFGCCELQGLIYVIGGMDGEDKALQSADMYDPISRRWSALPAMKYHRAYVGVASLNNCIYAVGGCGTNGSVAVVEKYCPEEEKWVEVAPLSEARRGVMVAAMNGLLYAMGGELWQGDTVNYVEVYDPQLDTWKKRGSMITCRSEGGAAAL